VTNYFSITQLLTPRNGPGDFFFFSRFLKTSRACTPIAGRATLVQNQRRPETCQGEKTFLLQPHSIFFRPYPGQMEGQRVITTTGPARFFFVGTRCAYDNKLSFSKYTQSPNAALVFLYGVPCRFDGHTLRPGGVVIWSSPSSPKEWNEGKKSEIDPMLAARRPHLFPWRHTPRHSRRHGQHYYS
jgi:hypothetical protein